MFDYDAVIIGGGFYGVSIAVYLKEVRGLQRVLLVEREDSLLLRASYNNQARIHNGYHYPRSFTTAYRSRINLPRFVRDYEAAVCRNFTKLYAIARRNSKVTSKQFERFCAEIGAPCRKADTSLSGLFDSRHIENVYLTEEYAFDAGALRRYACRSLSDAGVELRFGRSVHDVSAGVSGLTLLLNDGGTLRARYAFNCTYSGLTRFFSESVPTAARLKHEITEMALVDVPPALKSLGVTVMDGPFFSIMPFPDRSCHTLSHVRYTPHKSWPDVAGSDPYVHLDTYHRESRFDWMRRDAARLMPSAAHCRQLGSLFEVKTVLVKNETDDGRPILFERSASLPGLFSILGGKIDNIYDAITFLEGEPLLPELTARAPLSLSKMPQPPEA